MKPAPPVTMTTLISSSGAHFRVRRAADASLGAYVPLKVSESMIAGAMTANLYELGSYKMPSGVMELSGRG